MTTFKKTVMALAVLGLTAPAYAGSEIETLITMLHENGMVSDEQYGRLRAELEQNQQQVKTQQQKIETKLAEATKPDDVELKVKGGIAVKTRDGEFEAKLGGRLQIDGATYSGEPELGDGTEIRRARLYLKGKMYQDWGYKLEYDFANSGANAKGIADAFVTYSGFDNLEIMAGNFRDPFGLDTKTSTNNVTFTERSLMNAFDPGRHIGLVASVHQKQWSLWAGALADSITTTNGANHDQDEGWGLTSRLVFDPVKEKTKLMHLGASFNYRDTGGQGTAAFKQQAETHISGVNIVNTGTIQNVTDYSKFGVEAATLFGHFAAQAEYIRTSVSRSDAKNVEFDGWYAQTSYFLTGESRRYSKGAFKGVTPKSSVGNGGIGAWELGLRYSTVDLNDQDIDGGEAESVTLGLNWYPTSTLRFTANYVDVLDVKGGQYDDQEPSIFQVRSQWAF